MATGKLLVWFMAATSAIHAITLGPWQFRQPHPSDFSVGLAHDGKKFVLADWYGHVFTSISARNWTLQNTPGLHPLRSIAFGGSNFVAVGSAGVILRSQDGTNWVSSVSPTTNDLTCITYTGQRFIAVGQAGTIISSDSGTEFTLDASPLSVDLRNVDTGPGTIVAIGERTVLVSTNDGPWKKALVTTTNYFSDVAYFKGSYHNGFYASPDPMIWTNRVSGAGLSGVATVAATSNSLARVFAGKLEFSSDGTNWWTAYTPVPGISTLTTISNRFQLVGPAQILFANQFQFVTPMHLELISTAGPISPRPRIGVDSNGFTANFKGVYFTSKDAQSWLQAPIVAGQPLPNISDQRIGELPWAQATVLGEVEVSDNGETWNRISKPERVYVAAALGNTIIAAGTSNLWATVNRTNWTKIQTKEGPTILTASEGGEAQEMKYRWIVSLSPGSGKIVATTSWGELLFSQDGFAWQTEQTIFPHIEDAAITDEKVVIVTWRGIAEARLDGGVDAVRATKLRLTSDQLEFEGPLRYHEIQRTTNLATWNVFKTVSTNMIWQIDNSSQPSEFFRAVRIE
jgi:hypothetical protein